MVVCVHYCSIHSLATGILSLALAAACPAHNLKLSVCCLWTSRLRSHPGLTRPRACTYTFLRLLTVPHTTESVSVACGPTPASCPGPY